jgi:hypothetical protein
VHLTKRVNLIAATIAPSSSWPGLTVKCGGCPEVPAIRRVTGDGGDSRGTGPAMTMEVRPLRRLEHLVRGGIAVDPRIKSGDGHDGEAVPAGSALSAIRERLALTTQQDAKPYAPREMCNSPAAVRNKFCRFEVPLSQGNCCSYGAEDAIFAEIYARSWGNWAREFRK